MLRIMAFPNARTAIIALMVLAAGLRVLAAIALPDQQFPDAMIYRDSGAQLWVIGRLNAYNIMPLYPALIGLVGPGLGQLLLDITLSTATIWFAHALVLEIFSDRLAALLAAFGCAIYPHFIFFSVVGLTETLFIFLVIVALLAWHRGAFAAAAVLAVFAILTRPSFDLLAPILVVYFAWIVHRLPWQKLIAKLFAYALIYCALMAPWWMHNQRVYGTFVRLNLGGGEAFYMGNNPMNRTGGGIQPTDGDLTALRVSGNPVAIDAAAWKAGRDYVRENPGRFFEMVFIKFGRLWRPWPYADQYHNKLYVLLTLLSFAPVMLLAAFYLLRWGWREWRVVGPMALFVGYLTAVHVVTVGSVRYRLPMEPFVIVLAGVGAARLLRHHPRLMRIFGPAPKPVTS